MVNDRPQYINNIVEYCEIILKLYLINIIIPISQKKKKKKKKFLFYPERKTSKFKLQIF